MLNAQNIKTRTMEIKSHKGAQPLVSFDPRIEELEAPTALTTEAKASSQRPTHH
jgi:hypothetical protein